MKNHTLRSVIRFFTIVAIIYLLIGVIWLLLGRALGLLTQSISVKELMVGGVLLSVIVTLFFAIITALTEVNLHTVKVVGERAFCFLVYLIAAYSLMYSFLQSVNKWALILGERCFTPWFVLVVTLASLSGAWLWNRLTGSTTDRGGSTS